MQQTRILVAVYAYIGVGYSICAIRGDRDEKSLARKLQMPNEVVAKSTGNRSAWPTKTMQKEAETPSLVRRISTGKREESWWSRPYAKIITPPVVARLKAANRLRLMPSFV